MGGERRRTLRFYPAVSPPQMAGNGRALPWLGRGPPGRGLPLRGILAAMQSAARTTIDSAGRLVIPKAVRQAAGLQPHVPLEVRVREGRVEIERAPVEVRIEMRGKVAVAVPTEPVVGLTTEEVERIRREIREEREERWL